ncbi:hypothetical protein COO60DRAFT_869620 [Scenedesmus sp. NREL 46B-D3]|nr:hypothetical protein COO60DRAFT_869620 [Scenedesmus sp. NREL 46B-D3]
MQPIYGLQMVESGCFCIRDISLLTQSNCTAWADGICFCLSVVERSSTAVPVTKLFAEVLEQCATHVQHALWAVLYTLHLVRAVILLLGYDLFPKDIAARCAGPVCVPARAVLDWHACPWYSTACFELCCWHTMCMCCALVVAGLLVWHLFAVFWYRPSKHCWLDAWDGVGSMPPVPNPPFSLQRTQSAVTGYKERITFLASLWFVCLCGKQRLTMLHG